MGPWEWFIIVILLPAAVGYTIGRTRDRGVAGLLLGGLLSWLGVIIALLLPNGGEKCPACRERVKHDANVCKHCGATITVEGKQRIARLPG